MKIIELNICIVSAFIVAFFGPPFSFSFAKEGITEEVSKESAKVKDKEYKICYIFYDKAGHAKTLFIQTKDEQSRTWKVDITCDAETGKIIDFKTTHITCSKTGQPENPTLPLPDEQDLRKIIQAISNTMKGEIDSRGKITAYWFQNEQKITEKISDIPYNDKEEVNSYHIEKEKQSFWDRIYNVLHYFM